jgi:hypothetical protein
MPSYSVDFNPHRLRVVLAVYVLVLAPGFSGIAATGFLLVSMSNIPTE